MNGNPNSKDLYDRTYENGKAIAVCRTEIKELKADISDIKTNDIHGLNQKMDRMTWGLVVLLVGVVVNLAVLLIDKV